MRLNAYVAIPCLLLAGCGGGTTGTESAAPGKTTNQASTGFATSTSNVVNASAGTKHVSRQQLMSVDLEGSRGFSIVNRDIEIEATGDPNRINVKIDGVTFEMTSTDGETFTDTASGKTALFLSEEVLSAIRVGVIGVVDAGSTIEHATMGEIGIVAYGFNTDPMTLAARTGDATYRGGAGFVAAASEVNVAVGDGAITLNADFADRRIGGTMDMNVFDGVTNNSMTIGIPETDIVGNTFTTTLDIDPTEIGAETVTDTGLNGAFYGAAGEQVGGTFFATGTIVDDGVSIDGALHGGFAAAE